MKADVPWVNTSNLAFARIAGLIALAAMALTCALVAMQVILLAQKENVFHQAVEVAITHTAVLMTQPVA